MRTLATALAMSLLVPCLAPAQVVRLAQWSGTETGEQFGFAVAIGGDANGDGRADLAVGANTNDQGGLNAGKVSIYYGRSTPGTAPDVELIGPAGSFFGSAVAWAGDVNGDGFDDLLIGAYRDAEAGDLAGKAFVFFGGSPMDATPDLVLAGPGPGAYFGRAVCGAGDLNGDGIDDFAIGAPRTTNGTVYVYFGGHPPDGTADLVIEGVAADDRFGSSLAGCGNIDDRAGDDLLVGAPRASVTHLWEGAAYVFSGGAGFDATPDWVVPGAGAGDEFGTSVAAAGDVNGDGSPDIAIGAPYHNSGFNLDAGAAYVFYGGSHLDTTADFTVSGGATEEHVGTSVAGCGDVSGSGFGHFVVGAPGNDTNGTDAGKILLSPGGNPPQQGALIPIYGEAAGDEFGYAVAGVAGVSNLSFTGAPRPDLAVGAWGHGNGAAYVYGLAGSESAAPEAADAEPVLIRVVPNPSRDGADFRLDFLRGAGDGSRSGGGRLAETPRIAIYDAGGRLVRLLEIARAGAVWGGVHWDARAADGERIAPGVYFYRSFGLTRGGDGSGSITIAR